MEKNIEQNSIKIIQNGIMEWQPIETIPEGYIVFVWLALKNDKLLGEREYFYGRFVKSAKHKNYCFGWYIEDLDSVEKSLFEEGELYFSHWMPLPPKPPIINLNK
jgi:hypothetical protein